MTRINGRSTNKLNELKKQFIKDKYEHMTYGEMAQELDLNETTIGCFCRANGLKAKAADKTGGKSKDLEGEENLEFLLQLHKDSWFCRPWR